MRRSISLVSLAIVMVASACGGSDTVGPTDPPEPPVLQFITITRDTNFLMMGDTRQYKCVAHYDKGPEKEKDCTTSAVWTSSVPSVATIAMGVVTAVSPGDSQISASFKGKTVAVHISVRPLPVTLVSVSIEGDSILEAPGPLQLRALALNSDGTTEDVTNLVTWTYDNYFVGEVDSLGVVTPNGRGVMQVTASHKGHQESHQVTVVGTFWDDLLPLSPDAKEWAKEYFLDSHGRVVRFPDGLQTVYIGVGFNTSIVASALAELSQALDGVLTFVQVADSASANVVFTTEMNGLPGCGWGGPRSIRGVITSGIIRVRADCVDSEFILLHELFHAVGFAGHFLEAGIMSSTESSMEYGPLFTEVKYWLYHTKPGTMPIDG